jgi:hypothetical protein
MATRYGIDETTTRWQQPVFKKNRRRRSAAPRVTNYGLSSLSRS